MSDSQFFASSAHASCRANLPMNAFMGACGNSTYGQRVRFVQPIRSGQAQAPVFEEYSVLCGWAVPDADGACTNAKLFICSPHSCEVVKTRFFSRSFEDVNLKKGCLSLAPGPQTSADTRQNGQTTQVAERNGSSGRFGKEGWFAKKTASAPASLDLCGRLSVGNLGVNTEALTMLRGPIRRRPYNRGRL